jgi:hypothetical protein
VTLGTAGSARLPVTTASVIVTVAPFPARRAWPLRSRSRRRAPWRGGPAGRDVGATTAEDRGGHAAGDRRPCERDAPASGVIVITGPPPLTIVAPTD